MKSQVVHMIRQSSRDGTPNGVLEYCLTSCFELEGIRDDNNGNVKGGRSNNHKEYWPLESVHLWIGRRSAATNME